MTDAVTGTQANAAAGRSATFGDVAHWLAGVALLLLAYEAYTIGGWLADGPHQITADRSHGDGAWWSARIVEVLILASMVLLVKFAIRERRREGRLSVEALVLIGTASSAFWDPVYNWAAPAWLYSSNFLNVNDWLAHAPGVQNPAMGEQPWPIVMVVLGYPLPCLGFALLISAVVARIPGAKWRGVLAGFVVAFALTCASFALLQALGLLSAPGMRYSFLGDSATLFCGLSGGIVFWGLGLVLHFRDRDGRAFFERGARNGTTRVLAAIATCQLILIIGWGVLTVPFTTHPSPYPDLPAHIINGLCDTPGKHGTEYGPCPGTPGAEVPRR